MKYFLFNLLFPISYSFLQNRISKKKILDCKLIRSEEQNESEQIDIDLTFRGEQMNDLHPLMLRRSDRICEDKFLSDTIRAAPLRSSVPPEVDQENLIEVLADAEHIEFKNYDMKLIKILIHPGYGAYGLFSDEFEKEFKNEYNIDVDSLINYDPYYDVLNNNVNIERRYDSRIINIFEKLGKTRSNKGISCMDIVKIPLELINDFYISEYDGAEWLWCNISKKYKKILLSILENNNKITNEHMNKIYIIKECEKYLINNSIQYV